MRFRYFHINVKSNPLMGQTKVVHDVSFIHAFGRNGGFNEIKPWRYKRAVKKIFGKAYNAKSESPQVVNPKLFTVKDNYIVRMHGGFAAMTPVREVSVLETTSRNGLPVAFVESHYINKGKHIPLLQRKPAFRAKLHLRHWTKEGVVVADLVERGFTVFGSEDANERHMPVYVTGQKWVHNSGIDKMWYVEGPGAKVTVVKKGEISTDNLFTDHPALTAVFDLTKG